MTARHLLVAVHEPCYSSYLHRGHCHVEIHPKNRKFIVSLNMEWWSINGKLKLWKRDPSRFRLPIRTGGWSGHGSYVTPENVHRFHWSHECPVLQAWDLIWMETGGDE